ncbi:amino acid/amide ABC transporter ATP-binding protein 2, HAAT family [Roseovarius nanhaiticus]|uniref:Amino acid/amide ABC transporter ATP-binding protein 2, HAAT family n=1 Tax=Roseovarius nanhaiticus TaxID=573024 RepID=A0A1N7EB20_9RHOB|nr:ABC transporter ATP-binding protein [Roseovarius nanhaiticus]SEK78477.1 amino acid/amide ABC transporter ATP-binding protein 2, HAAT family [Roseovarius nanhaiticus]SIR85135.1 amino acid/amide ABC transporter ATP-binding protein 2, HAAT family [Roseovarius nanhaiticus]
MLALDRISAGYDGGRVLRDLSLEVQSGEILCLMGRNGAGKTTAMRAIMGLIPLMDGRVMLDGTEVSALAPHHVPRAGIGYVPQGRRLFAGLSVAQNLEIGMRARRSPPEVLEEVLDLFPRLRERYRQPAQTLSGGEQQMLAMARALCLRPKALLLDEPTEGLQPSMVAAIQEAVLRMRGQDTAILLVEQRMDAVLEVADRIAFIENGRGGAVLPVDELRADLSVAARYLGV